MYRACIAVCIAMCIHVFRSWSIAMMLISRCIGGLYRSVYGRRGDTCIAHVLRCVCVCVCVLERNSAHSSVGPDHYVLCVGVRSLDICLNTSRYNTIQCMERKLSHMGEETVPYPLPWPRAAPLFSAICFSPLRAISPSSMDGKHHHH